MNFKKNLFIIILFKCIYTGYACQCPLIKVNKEGLAKYNTIFQGQVVSVNQTQNFENIYFNVQQLFKGQVSKQFTISYKLNDPCKVSIQVGDTWLIYCNATAPQKGIFNFCSGSRKYYKITNEDFIESITRVSFQEEVDFLNKHFETTLLNSHEAVSKVNNSNTLPSALQTLILLGISGVLLIVINVIIKKV